MTAEKRQRQLEIGWVLLKRRLRRDGIQFPGGGEDTKKELTGIARAIGCSFDEIKETFQVLVEEMIDETLV